MGFLSEEAENKIGSILDGNEKSEENAAPVPAPEPAAAAVEAKPEEVAAPEPTTAQPTSETPADVKQEAGGEKAETEAPKASAADSAAEEEEVPSGHRVPYNRFKKVIDARNEFKTEADKLKAQVAELQERAKTYSAQPQVQPPVQQKEPETDDEAWLKNLLGEDQPSEKKGDPAVEALSKRLHETEVRFARQQLEAEITQAVTKYPTATRELILQAVSQDPSLSAEQVAEQYSSWLAKMEEAAISRYLTENPTAQAPEAKKADAPPRPKTAGTTQAASATEKRAAPKSVEEASAELRRRWDEISPFTS